MEKPKVEFYVGLFVVIGLICGVYLFTVLGEVSLIQDKRYTLQAYFSSVSGLKQGATIEMAGVEIGEVSSVVIDKERMMAKVELSIDRDISITDDAVASVKTAGIIGQKYINIVIGGSDIMLEPGDEILDTESVLDIESLIRQMIFSSDKK